MSRVFAVKPSPWEIDHAQALVAGERYAESHGLSPPHDAFWRDLERRYDRDAEAFAVNHHNFKLFLDGLLIEGCERPEAGLASLVAEPHPPRVASAPEPSSLALGLAAVASLVAAWAWAGRGETPEATRARHQRECETYRDNDPLL